MRTLFLLWWLLWASMAQAQPTTVDLESISPVPTGEWDFEGGKFHLPETTVASLPAAGTSGRIYIVTDTHGTLCASSGGGTTRLICRDTGAAWEAIGSGGGGGGTECASAPCNLNVSTTLNSKGICLADGTNCPGVATPTPTATSTTATSTPTPTLSATPTATATATATPTATTTPRICPTNKDGSGPAQVGEDANDRPVCAATSTPTTSPTPTLSATPTATSTPTVTVTATPTVTQTPMPSPTPDAADQVSRSTAAGVTSYTALPDCDTAGYKCVYDTTAHAWGAVLEDDPQVGTVTAGKLCVANGSGQVECITTVNAGTDVTADLEEEGQIGGVTVGGTPGDDKVIIGDSSSGATWRSIATCVAAGGVVQYDAAANASGFTCHTLTDADIPNSITIDAAAALTNGDKGDFTCTSGTCTLDADSVSATQLDALGVESEMESVLDLPDLQGVLPLSKGGTNNASLSNCATGQVATVAGGKVDCTTVPQADIPAAQAFVVDLAGNDTTGTGSVNQPVKTINKALDLVAATGQACALTCAADGATTCSACFGGTNVYTCSVVGDCSAGATSCTGGRCVYPCNENSDCAGGGTCKGSRCSSNSARTCSVDGDCPGGDTCSVANNNSMCGGAACSSTPKTYGVLMNPGYWNEQVTVARTNLPGCVALVGNGKLTNQIIDNTSGCVIDYSNTNRFSMSFATAVNTGDGDAICSSGGGFNPTFISVGAVHDGKGRDLHISGRGNITTNILDITTFGRGAAASGYSIDIENWGASCSHDRTIGCYADSVCNALSGGSVCDGAASADVDFRGGLVQAGSAAYCVGGTQDGQRCESSATACTGGGGTCDGGAAVRFSAKACGNGFNNLLISPFIKGNGTGAGASTGLKIEQATCSGSSPFPDNLRVIVNNGTIQGTDVIGGVFDSDTSLDVGAGTTLWNQGLSYDVSQRSITGTMLYGDSSNFTGGMSWLGWVRTDPPNPQSGECWYANDVGETRCRLSGTTVTQAGYVNAAAVRGPDLNDTVPSAPTPAASVTPGINVKWQKDASVPNKVSAYLPYTAPLTISNGMAGLALAAPLTVSGGNLTLGVDAPLALNGSNLDVTTSPTNNATVVGTGRQLAVSGGLTIGGGTSALDFSADRTLGCSAASASQAGCLATSDFTLFANKTRTHATDCSSLTDGKAGQICEDLDDGKLWVCLPSSGDCDTVGEWKQIERLANKDAANGYAQLDSGAKLPLSYLLEVVGLADLSNVAITSPASGQMLSYNGSGWVNSTPTWPSITTKVRTSNSNAKNNNNTLWDDQGTGPDLTGFAVTSGTTYRVEGDLFVTTGTTADIQLAFKGPSGSTCRIGATSFNTPTTSAEPPAFYTDCDNAPTGVKVADMAGSSLNHIRISGYFTAGGNGNLDLQWSQSATQSTNTTVDAGSAITVTQQ